MGKKKGNKVSKTKNKSFISRSSSSSSFKGFHKKHGKRVGKGGGGGGGAGAAAADQQQPTTSVYKRIPVLPPVFHGFKGAKDRFLQPEDAQYNDVVKHSYQGFVVDPEESYPSSFHDAFYQAFNDLESSGMFLFDLTQPAGLNTKVARTFVTRCLVGEPGITYKYLGLRMFAFPWSKGAIGATESMIAIGRLNENLIQRTDKLLRQLGRENVGSCQYNLTLINRCYPDGKVVKLKDEPTFQKDRCTVSWHADSTLEHYSSIGVYHCTKPSSSSSSSSSSSTKTGEKGKDKEKDWRVAFRVHHNAEGPLMGKASLIDANKASINSAPALAVPLPSKAAYYLLDDFNHHHQHSVLAGSTDRYASTHRVCRTEGHTFASIHTRCTRALQGNGASAKQIRAEQSALNELEFEWIRQMYIQGELHYQLHSWWHEPMTQLLELWSKLTERIEIAHLQVLQDVTGGIEKAETTLMNTLPEEGRRKLRKQLIKRRKRCETVDVETFDAMIEGLVERQEKREGWQAREKDPAFQSVSINCRPMKIPFPSINGPAASSAHPDSSAGQAALQTLIDQVRSLKAVYVKTGGKQQQQQQQQQQLAVATTAKSAFSMATEDLGGKSSTSKTEGLEGTRGEKIYSRAVSSMLDQTNNETANHLSKKDKKKEKKKRKGGPGENGGYHGGSGAGGGKKTKIRF